MKLQSLVGGPEAGSELFRGVKVAISPEGVITIRQRNLEIGAIECTMLPPVASQEHTAILPGSPQPLNSLFSTTTFQSFPNPDSMSLRKAPPGENLPN